MSENHIVRYLSALTEQGSFSKASQVLDISQPSLSQFVQRLEAESGVTLVDRASRPLTLTFAGE
jgi:DNA-binding transcriptional LysR family regulator